MPIVSVGSGETSPLPERPEHPCDLVTRNGASTLAARGGSDWR